MVVSVCLGVFLLFVDFKMMFVVVGLLLAVTIFITKVVKPRLNSIGESAREEQAGLYKWILQGVTGIKDVKVHDKVDYFTSRYRENASDKFWKLEERIKKDRKHPGVILEISKSNMLYDIVALINYGVITEKDLDDFSDDLKERVGFFLKR